MKIFTDEHILDRVKQLRECTAVIRRYALSPVVTAEELPSLTGKQGLAKIEEKRHRLEVYEKLGEIDARLDKITARVQAGEQPIVTQPAVEVSQNGHRNGFHNGHV